MHYRLSEAAHTQAGGWAPCSAACLVFVQHLQHPCCTPICSLQDNRETAERMLTHGEQLLAEWKHPDPIIGEGQGSSSCCSSGTCQGQLQLVTRGVTVTVGLQCQTHLSTTLASGSSSSSSGPSVMLPHSLNRSRQQLCLVVRAAQAPGCHSNLRPPAYSLSTLRPPWSSWPVGQHPLPTPTSAAIAQAQQ